MKTFTEKLQWLKIYHRKPEYTRMVDKYAVKDYVANLIGKEYIIPTLGVWDKPEDIDWDSLPNQFVLKTIHGGGSNGVFICKDKTTFDKRRCIKEIRNSLRSDLYWAFREWPYKDAPKRIIAEKFMAEYQDDGIIKDLKDYKFFCFNGKVKMFKIDFNRYDGHQANYYARDKILLLFGETICPPDCTKEFEFPLNFNKMLDLSEKLANNIPLLGLISII